MSNFNPALYLPEHDDAEHREEVLAADQHLRRNGHHRRVTADVNGVYRWTCECGEGEYGYGFHAYAEDAWREAHGLDPIVPLMG